MKIRVRVKSPDCVCPVDNCSMAVLGEIQTMFHCVVRLENNNYCV